MSETIHRLGTRALHAGQVPDPATNSRAVPIYSTSISVGIEDIEDIIDGMKQALEATA